MCGVFNFWRLGAIWIGFICLSYIPCSTRQVYNALIGCMGGIISFVLSRNGRRTMLPAAVYVQCPVEYKHLLIKATQRDLHRLGADLRAKRRRDGFHRECLILHPLISPLRSVVVCHVWDHIRCGGHYTHARDIYHLHGVVH